MEGDGDEDDDDNAEEGGVRGRGTKGKKRIPLSKDLSQTLSNRQLFDMIYSYLGWEQAYLHRRVNKSFLHRFMDYQVMSDGSSSSSSNSSKKQQQQ